MSDRFSQNAATILKKIASTLPVLAGAGVAAWLAPHMMRRVMPRMMKGMMKSMMGNQGDRGFNPMEMCEKMMSGMTQTSELAAYATPEVRALFEDWVQEVESAVLAFVQQQATTNPADIAAHLKISESSAIFFISKLAREGKLKIGGVEAVVAKP